MPGILSIPRLIACLLVVLVLTGSPVAVAQETSFDPATFDIGLDPVVDGLVEPVYVTNAGDDRLFVVERGGTIQVVINETVGAEPFLDISDRVGANASEQGLLGLAFPVNHADSGLFYVNYTDLQGDTVVAEFRLTGDPDVADPATERIILTQDQPAWNHNGGMLAFGPDNYLYIGLGDGGGQGDPDGNGQRLDTWLGKILRIEVDPQYTAGAPYLVPGDNPYVDDPDARPEIWATGLRNPWRFSFDRETGDLWIADVGQGEYEEVNVIGATQGGANFGWNVKEGPECYLADACDSGGLVDPVFTYTHSSGDGCSVTGGYVSRGEEFAWLYGVYVLADFCTGLIWGGAPGRDGVITFSEPIETGLNVSSFGEGADGRLYVVDLNGTVYELVPPL
jgi:glucose/arabinose dehydrogenase